MTAKVIKLEQGRCKRKAKTQVSANARRTNKDLDGCECAWRGRAFRARLGYCAIFSEGLIEGILRKLRISIVEFLNTAPLVWGFIEGPLAGKYDLSFTV